MKKTLATLAVYLLLLTLMTLLEFALAPRGPYEVPPTWENRKAVCPAGYYVYVDEGEAIEGQDAAHCVRE